MTSFVGVTLLNTVFGAFCLMFFGLGVDTIVLNDLPDTWVVQAVRVALVVDLLFTFIPRESARARTTLGRGAGGLGWGDGHNCCRLRAHGLRLHPCAVILPSRDVLEFSLFGRGDNVSHVKKCLVRAVLVAVTGGLAVGIPDISALVNLMTGISVTYNTFILCPLIYMKLVR